MIDPKIQKELNSCFNHIQVTDYDNFIKMVDGLKYINPQNWEQIGANNVLNKLLEELKEERFKLISE
jgi:hypothetical protein